MAAPALMIVVAVALHHEIWALQERTRETGPLLSRAAASIDRLVHDELERLELQASLLASAPSLPQMFLLAEAGDSEGPVGAWLAGTLVDGELDAIALVDLGGRVLAAAPGVGAPARDDLPALVGTLAENQLAESSSGLVVAGPQLYAYAAAISVRNFEPLGVVLVARAVDGQDLGSWSEMSGMGVAFLSRRQDGWATVASTVEPAVASAMARAASRRDSTGETIETRVESLEGGGVARLQSFDGAPASSLVLGIWSDSGIWQARRKLLLELGAMTAAALILASLLGLLLARRRLIAIGEIESLFEESREALGQGARTQPTRTSGHAFEGSLKASAQRRVGRRSRLPSELGSLANRLESWRASSRGQRELADRVALAEARIDRAELEQPAVSAGNVTLLGWELRSSTALGSRGQPAEVGVSGGDASDNAWFRAARSVLASCGGRFEGRLGHRILSSFDGASGAQRALAAASQIGLQSQLERNAEAAAAVVGANVAGDAVASVESLLREAQPGEILISESLRGSLTDALARIGLTVRERLGLFDLQTVYGLDFEQAAELVRGLTAHGASDQVADSKPTDGATAPAPLAVGSIIAERYQIWSWLRAGSQAVEYLAWDREAGMRVLVQQLKPGVFMAPLEQDRLARSLALARRLEHAHVVRPIELLEHQGQTLVISEPRLPVSLRAVLDLTGRLSLPAAMYLGQGLCSALSAAHAVRLFHLDLGPDKVWLSSAGGLQVADFGLAQPRLRERGKAVDGGLLVGGVEYLAPEQVDGPTPDARSDVYGLGALLYEVVSGRRPFESGEPMTILRQHLEEQPSPPSRWAPHLPSWLDEVLLRCLEKSPDDRFRDGSELLATWQERAG